MEVRVWPGFAAHDGPRGLVAVGGREIGPRSSGDARWRPPKRGSRLPATLAPDGDASRSQQSDPSATATFDLVQSGGWLPPPYSNLSVPPACDAQAERPRRVWVGLLSG